MVKDTPDKATGLWGYPKILSNIGAVGFLFVFLGYVITDLVRRQDAGAALAERLMDKFDKTLEKHDDRQREWMRSHGDRITAENEKTRSVLIELQTRQDKANQENARLHESQLIVLKQILSRSSPQ